MMEAERGAAPAWGLGDAAVGFLVGLSITCCLLNMCGIGLLAETIGYVFGDRA